ncbi:hypothetical protein KR044_006180 [Drosophila immigrans]|nr:hypothetical protein KR044_006180 [Drosophila immigrans]
METSPDMSAAAAMTVMPVNQLLAYLSGAMCPPAATTTPSHPNPQQAPSFCPIQLHSLLTMQQQQQQQQPTLMRFELPCMLTGFSSGPMGPEQPPFALQLLSLPYGGSMPPTPFPIPAESLPTPSKQTMPATFLQPAESCASPPPPPPPPPARASLPTYPFPCTNSAAGGPKKPILVNRKSDTHSNIDSQFSYGRRPSFPLANGNGNDCRNSSRNGNGNSCMAAPWHCSYCSHCCCLPHDHRQRP